jgi:hypothetical protein
MASRESPDIPFDRELDIDISEEQEQTSVVITNVPQGILKQDLFIHFQKESNGGGEVNDLLMLEDCKAVVIFDEQEGL